MESFALIIFGITGNLTQKYLIPALYDMEEKGILPEDLTVFGIARKQLSKEEFEKYFDEVLHMDNLHHKHPIKQDIFKKLCSRFHYLSGNLDDPNFYKELNNNLSALKKAGVSCDNRIFYLATYPELYEDIFKNLKSNHLSEQNGGWVRIMVEKPIGSNLPSAQKLNKLLLEYFKDDQIYRLDHYLGKETLQNILTFRFGNGIFEPLINNQHIDHIQITAAEDFGIGKRGGYYDKVGALIDVGQNHLLQMLAFTTMESPTEFTSQAVTEARVNVLKQLMPYPKNIVFGQYEGYTTEENIDSNSSTETYFAFKTEIQNDRFKGVPIYIRGGKKMHQTVTEISIVFKNPISRIFKNLDDSEEPNVLIYRIQPNEGIVLKILTKKPGGKAELEPTYMQFCYRQDPSGHYLPDPYERLLLDAIKGDQTFFSHAQEVEAEWSFIDALKDAKKQPIIYKGGSWGPKEADELLEKDDRAWLEPSMQFCNF